VSHDGTIRAYVMPLQFTDKFPMKGMHLKSGKVVSPNERKLLKTTNALRVYSKQGWDMSTT
jgi:hypothetical protein